MTLSGRLFAICIWTGLFLCCPDACPSAPRILNTAYKTFQVHTVKGTNILCEPYQVKEGDWVYKIFRKKGMLSKMDFPFFLSIFEQINPGIADPNTIKSGQRIIIPLKKINARDFHASTSGKVVVPILQMSELSPPASKHNASASPGHAPSLPAPLVPTGNIHGINAGISHGNTPPLGRSGMEIIRRYISQRGGHLLNKGHLYLPGPVKDVKLNLSDTPVIERQGHSRIVVVPDAGAHKALFPLLENLWQDITFMEIDDLKKALMSKSASVLPLPADVKKATETVLHHAGFKLQPFNTQMQLNDDIHLTLNAHRIARTKGPDVIVFFNDIYGNPLSWLKDQGFSVVLMTKKTQEKQFIYLFKALGVVTMIDPVFKNRSTDQRLMIPGLFIDAKPPFFIAGHPLQPAFVRFLTAHGMAIFQMPL